MSVQIPLGRVGFVIRDDYSAGKQCFPLDVVTYNNIIWACLQKTTAAPSTGSSAWLPMLKGLDSILATTKTAGAIIVGNGLSITTAGVLSVAFIEGSGLVMNEKGQIYFDPGQMSTEKFEALLKSIRVPNWLARNATWYVNGATGNDKNDGLTADKAFKSIQAAIDNISSNYNLGKFYATILVAPWTQSYDSFIMTGYAASTGSVIISGDSAGGVTVKAASGVCALLNAAAGRYDLRNNMTLSMNLSEYGNGQAGCLGGAQGATVYAANVHFEHLVSDTSLSNTKYLIRLNGGRVEIGEGCSLYSAPSDSSVKTSGLLIDQGGLFQLSGDLSIGGVYSDVCRASFGGVFRRSYKSPAVYADISGAAEGRRYFAESYGIVHTYGGGPEFFPGSTVGGVNNGLYL